MLLKGSNQPCVLQRIFELVFNVNTLWPFLGRRRRCGNFGRRALFALLGCCRRAISLRTAMATGVRRSSVGSYGNLAGADYSTHRDFGLFSSNMFLVGVMLSPFVTQSAHSAFSSSKLLVSILPRTTAAPPCYCGNCPTLSNSSTESSTLY